MSVFMLSVSTSLMIAPCCPDGLMKRTDFIKTTDGKSRRKWHLHPCFHKRLLGHICAQRPDTEGTPALWHSLRTWTGPSRFSLNPFIRPSCWKCSAWSHSDLGSATATLGLFSGAGWAPVSYNHSSQVSSSSVCPWRSSCFSPLHLHHNLIFNWSCSTSNAVFFVPKHSSVSTMGLTPNVLSERGTWLIAPSRNCCDLLLFQLLSGCSVLDIIFSFTCSNTLNNNTLIYYRNVWLFFIIIVVCGFQKQLAVFLLPV